MTAIALLATPALALAKVPVHGSTKVAIAKVAGWPASQYVCLDVYLAAKGSPWAIVTEPAGDQHISACRGVQTRDFAILHYSGSRWHQVSASDEVVCPFQSYPHQPTVPGKILQELTGHYCRQ